MKVNTLEVSAINDIGHAFGYYDYGEETGLFSVFSSQEAVTTYIRGYVRGMLAGGLLYTNSRQGEGYIAYQLPGQKIGLKVGVPLLKGLFQAMRLKEVIRFCKVIKRGGPGLKERLDKKKQPYVFVGLVCVREAYQERGHMRQVMELAFAEGQRLGVPVILETDARSKCDKYLHLGMELAGTRDLGAYGTLYDLIKYPKKEGERYA